MIYFFWQSSKMSFFKTTLIQHRLLRPFIALWMCMINNIPMLKRKYTSKVIYTEYNQRCVVVLLLIKIKSGWTTETDMIQSSYVFIYTSTFAVPDYIFVWQQECFFFVPKGVAQLTNNNFSREMTEKPLKKIFVPISHFSLR